MKKFKQLSAFFLALVMVLSLIPAFGYTYARAETPTTLQEGANVVIAKEEASGVWSQAFYNDNKAGDVAAFWNARGIYFMYPEQTTKAVTVNGQALNANQDSTTRDFVILEFSKFGIELDDYNYDFYVEITGAYTWSGWILLRRDAVVREGNNITNSGEQYCNGSTYVIPNGASHVIDVTLNINDMPAYRGFDKAPMVYWATKTGWNTTGIAISFTDELHTAAEDSSYRMLLAKSDTDGHLYASIARDSGDAYGSKAYDLGVVIDTDAATAQTVRLRWVTELQTDGTYTSYLFANGKFICARDNTRITADTGTGNNKTLWIRNHSNRLVDGETATFNFTAAVNRYYADSFDLASATLDYLTVDKLLGTNTSADAISYDLTLPTCYGNLNGVKLVWTATGAIDNEGVVDTSVDGAAATLTATIEGTSVSKTFNFVVKAPVSGGGDGGSGDGGEVVDNGDIYAAHLLAGAKQDGKVEEADFFLNGKLSDAVRFGFTWNSKSLFMAYKKPAADAELKLTIAGEEVTIDAANVYNTDGDYIEVMIPWDAVNFEVQNYGDKTTLKVELGTMVWNGEIVFTFGNDSEDDNKGSVYPDGGDVAGVTVDDSGKISFKTFTGTDTKTYVQTSHAGYRTYSNADLAASAAESVIEFDFTPTFLEEATNNPTSHWNWKAITFAMADDSFTDDSKNAAFVFGIMNKGGTYQIASEAIDGGVMYFDTGIPSTSTETMHIRVVVDNEGSTYTSNTDYSEINLKIYVNGLLVAERDNARAKNPNGLYERMFEVVSFRYDSGFKYFAECSVENIRIYKAPSAVVDDANTNNNPSTGDNGIAIFAALLVASMTGMALLMVPTIRKKLI